MSVPLLLFASLHEKKGHLLIGYQVAGLVLWDIENQVGSRWLLLM